jgi:rod shape determining protein RodA
MASGERHTAAAGQDMISSAIIPQPLARLPWRLIWLVALICTIGVVTLYSAAGGSASPWR